MYCSNKIQTFNIINLEHQYYLTILQNISWFTKTIKGFMSFLGQCILNAIPPGDKQYTLYPWQSQSLGYFCSQQQSTAIKIEKPHNFPGMRHMMQYFHNFPPLTQQHVFHLVLHWCCKCFTCQIMQKYNTPYIFKYFLRVPQNTHGH